MAYDNMERVSPDNIELLLANEVFCFGSNEAGIHGAGAAKQALKFGAKNGIGFGQIGNTFAIPTKDFNIQTLPLHTIKEYVDCFIGITQTRYGKQFKYLVTAIGCGYAGYEVEDIAPLFEPAIELKNIYLPKSFWDYYKNKN